MPFTPLHMGPGILLKACLRGSFSLMVFGWAQIVMDLQPLWAILAGEGALHGLTHTYPGASLLAVVVALSGKYLGEAGLRIAGNGEALPIGWPVAFLSAGLGTFSHVLLDSVMHDDVVPFWPLATGNGLLGIVSVDTLHWLCLAAGGAGTAAYLALNRLALRRR